MCPIDDNSAGTLQLLTIIQNDYILLEVDERLSYLQATILKQPTDEVFRNNTRLIAEVAINKGLLRALFDIRLRDYLDISNQNWLLREIIPLFAEINMRFAYLTTLQKVELMDTSRVQGVTLQKSDSKSGLKIEIFVDKEKAQNWLLE